MPDSDSSLTSVHAKAEQVRKDVAHSSDRAVARVYSAVKAKKAKVGAGQSEDNRSLSISARLHRLQFHTSGKFRVLQLADIQDGPKISADTIRLIESACDAARPDLVVFTGNQIAGYDPAYAETYRKRRWATNWDGVYAVRRNIMRGFSSGANANSADSHAAKHERREDLDEEYAAHIKKTKELVTKSITQFLQPLIDRDIPFAVTYGNHDFQCGIDIPQLDEIYRSFPGCVNPDMGKSASAEEIRESAGSLLTKQSVITCQEGTFSLPVLDQDGEITVLGLTVLNSGDYAREGGYGHPSKKALKFLRTSPTKIGAKSMIFQHLPLEQYYRLLKPVSATTAHAIQGYAPYDSKCFVIDPELTESGSYVGEGIGCPQHDSGEFDVMKATNGYFALCSAHDHRNGFAGRVDGILLCATPTCGFGS